MRHRSPRTSASPGRISHAFAARTAFAPEFGPGEPGRLSQVESGTDSVTLVALVKLDLALRFEEGDRPEIHEYLERYPALGESPDLVLSLVYEEYCLLEEYGEAPDPSEFCRRYGDWKESLASQLAYHQVLSRVSAGPQPPPLDYPKLGERFQGFTLRSILGQGGAARVFLAEEDQVGGRKVALKVSANRGHEPSILGKLDHANIVPVHSVVVHEESGLRGLCMPYRPGATLDQVIRHEGPKGLPRSARAFHDALVPEGHGTESSRRGGERPGWADFPLRGSYPDAVAWMALSLANALAHAHDRKILHRDVKPANILLTYREGPQLLDFNLAHDPNAATEAEAALRGGTLPYMAPEQLEAFLNPDRWGSVGRQADIYALGLVMRELVTGMAPDGPDQGVSLARTILGIRDRQMRPPTPIRSINPKVRPSLASIIGKCLEFDPAARYDSGEQLAEDLRRYLQRRPLKYVPYTSQKELVGNWVVKHATGLAATSILVCLAAGLVAANPARNRAEDGRPAGSDRSVGIRPLGPTAGVGSLPEFQDAWEAYWLEGAESADFRLKAIEAHRSFAGNDNAWPTLLRALIDRQSGKTERAIANFNTASHQFDAQKAFDAVVARRPDDSQAWYYRGHAYAYTPQDREDLETALKSYEKAIALRPDDPQAIQSAIQVAELLSTPRDYLRPLIELGINFEEKLQPIHLRRGGFLRRMMGFYQARLRLIAEEALERAVALEDRRSAPKDVSTAIASATTEARRYEKYLDSHDGQFVLWNQLFLGQVTFAQARLDLFEGRRDSAAQLVRELIAGIEKTLQITPSLRNDPSLPDTRLDAFCRQVRSWADANGIGFDSSVSTPVAQVER